MLLRILPYGDDENRSELPSKAGKLSIVKGGISLQISGSLHASHPGERDQAEIASQLHKTLPHSTPC